jgi:hypothetical protein
LSDQALQTIQPCPISSDRRGRFVAEFDFSVDFKGRVGVDRSVKPPGRLSEKKTAEAALEKKFKTTKQNDPMKKLIALFIAAAMLAVTSDAHAAPVVKPPPTNVVTRINFQLTFTSQFTNTTKLVTNITIHISGKVKTFTTNILTVQTAKAVSTPVTTASIIKALAPNAPKGAYFAQVESFQNDGAQVFPADYFAIRVGDTNFLIVDSITSINKIRIESGKTTVSASKSTFAAGDKATSLQQLTFTTATLGFDVSAVSQQTFTGAYISVDNGLFSFPVTDNTFSVIGSGSDSLGTNEIVTGTITANGTSLGH